MRFFDAELLTYGGIAVLVGLIADDWLTGASILTLLVGVKLVSTRDGLFVFPLAFTFHWMQTSIGLLYLTIAGRAVPTVELSDYRPMVLVGLGCCLALAAGIRVGLWLRAKPDPGEARPQFAFGFGLILAMYVGTIALEGSLAALAPEYPSLRQIIVSFDTARLGILFLILRRLCRPRPRWGLLALVVAGEIVLGITGFFAGFREPVVLAVLAVLEIFDRRNKQHWLALGVGGASAVLLGLLWMSIRVEYRKEYVEVDKFQTSRSARVERIGSLTSGFINSDSTNIWAATDSLVDRLWTVYYPALALARVPRVLPHTNGAIVGAALVHIVTPRIFFPNKAELPSDSEEVRKYSGVHVAGRETNTSIAFGYAAEAYIDFGIPLMFAPVFIFGVAVGLLYALFRQLIWHRELFVAFATVTFWLTVYLFERSWATMLGVSLGFMVYLGVPVVLLDRFLLIKSAKQSREATELLFGQADPASGVGP
jgi:hypothetical protein